MPRRKDQDSWGPWGKGAVTASVVVTGSPQRDSKCHAEERAHASLSPPHGADGRPGTLPSATSPSGESGESGV